MNLFHKTKMFHNGVNKKLLRNKKGVSMIQALGVSIAVSIISLTISSIVLNNAKIVNTDLLSSPASTEARASVDQSVYEVEKYINTIDMTDYSARELNDLLERDVLPTISNDYGVTVIDVSDLYNASGSSSTATGDYSIAYRIGSDVNNNVIYRDILVSSSGSGGSSSGLVSKPGDVLNSDYINQSIYSAKKLMLAGGVYLESDIITNNYYMMPYPLKYYNAYNMPDSLFAEPLVDYNFPTITVDSNVKTTGKSFFMCTKPGVYYNYYNSGCANYGYSKNDLHGEDYKNTDFNGTYVWNGQTTGNAAFYLDRYSTNSGVSSIKSSSMATNAKNYSYDFDGEQYALDVLAESINYRGTDFNFSNAYDILIANGYDEYDYKDLSNLKGNASSFAYKGRAADLKNGYILLEDRLKFKDENNVAYIDGNGYPVKFSPSKKNEQYSGILVINGDLVVDVSEIPADMDMLIIVNGDVSFDMSTDGKYLSNGDDNPLYVIASGNIEFSGFNRNSYSYSKNYFKQLANRFEYQLHAYLVAGGSITVETLTSDFISMVGGMYAFGNKPSNLYSDISGIILTSYRKTASGGKTKDVSYDRLIFHDIDFAHTRDFLPTFMYEFVEVGGGGTSNYHVTDFGVSSKKNFNG